jgi:polysaccharide biosynthesis protein PslG
MTINRHSGRSLTAKTLTVVLSLVFFGSFARGLAAASSSDGAFSSNSCDRRAGPGAIPSTYFGLTINHNESVPFPTSLGFGTTRSWDATRVSWSDINTASGIYDWSGFDAWMDYVSNHGVDVVYTLGRTPLWASSKPTAPSGFGPGQCAPPVNISDWDNFVAAVVQRAAGRIRYWELWNEPQDSTEYCGTSSQMVVMAQHAYKIIKTASADFQVVTPATLYDNSAGPKWLDSYFADGGTRYTDIVSFHGYLLAPAENHTQVIQEYRAITSKYAQQNKPIWNTESDWGNIRGAENQAAYLAKYYLLQWHEGLERFYWYAYDNTRYGTLYSDGALTKAGIAYQQVSNWMVGAAQDQPCVADADSTWTCRFTRTGGYQALAVWNSTKSAAYTPAPEYKQYRDLTGALHSISGPLTIGNAPVLLETNRFRCNG